jgi:hypothetical protein
VRGRSEGQDLRASGGIASTDRVTSVQKKARTGNAPLSVLTTTTRPGDAPQTRHQTPDKGGVTTTASTTQLWPKAKTLRFLVERPASK